MNKTMLIVSVVVVLGIVYGLASQGIVNIPGISPVKLVKNPFAGKVVHDENGKAVVDEETKKPKLHAKEVTKEELDKITAIEEKLKKQKAAAASPPPRRKPQKPAAKPKIADDRDPAKGHAKVAELWDGMEISKLLEITRTWKTSELAPVFLRMEPEKVTEILAAMDPKDAGSLSRALREEAAAMKAKVKA